MKIKSTILLTLLSRINYSKLILWEFGISQWFNIYNPHFVFKEVPKFTSFLYTGRS